jgi:hypothetical protein
LNHDAHFLRLSIATATAIAVAGLSEQRPEGRLPKYTPPLLQRDNLLAAIQATLDGS